MKRKTTPRADYYDECPPYLGIGSAHANDGEPPTEPSTREFPIGFDLSPGQDKTKQANRSPKVPGCGVGMLGGEICCGDEWRGEVRYCVQCVTPPKPKPSRRSRRK